MDFTSLTEIDLQLIPVLGGDHSIFLDGMAVCLTSSVTWIAFYLTLFFVVVRNNETIGQIILAVGAAASCVFLADVMADVIVKPMTMRLRPLNDPSVRPLLDVVAGVADNNYSFFSAHAANTMSVAVLFSLMIRSKLLSVGMIMWSLVNCWTRIYLGMHYPSDVFVGIIWGLVVGLVVYTGYIYIYRRVTDKLHFITSQYTSTGYSKGDVIILINILLATVAYAIFTSIYVI